MQPVRDEGEDAFVIIAETDDSRAGGADLGDVDVGPGVAVEGSKRGGHCGVVLWQRGGLVSYWGVVVRWWGGFRGLGIGLEKR